MTYPPPSPPYLGPPAHTSAGSNMPINRIVLHGTVSPTVAGGARATAAYFKTPAAGGSAHYVVDPGEVVQATYDGVIAWHAPPNANSLGIEFCDWVGGGPNRDVALPLSRWDDEDHYRMLKLGARLVAELCLAYDVPVRMVGPWGLKLGRRGICEHSDVSEAFRQSSHWDLGNFPRRRFIGMVAQEVKALTAPAAKSPTPAVVVAKPPSLITQARDVLEQAYRNTRKPFRKARIERALNDLPKQ